MALSSPLLCLQQEQTNSSVYEKSEMRAYVVELLMASGKHEEALAKLDEYGSEIHDKRGAMEMRAQLLLNLGKVRAAFRGQGEGEEERT